MNLVEDTTIHEEYLANPIQRSPYNVALLKLSEKIDNDVPTLLGDHFNLWTGQQLATLGWGKAEIKVGDSIFGDLILEDVEYIQAPHCNRSSLWNMTILPNLMCALNQKQQASCVGMCCSCVLF